jgi:ribosomal protein S18 acetylase RimI-like enzyme
MKSKQNLQGTTHNSDAKSDWSDSPRAQKLTCALQDLPDKTWSFHAWAKGVQPLTLFDVLHTASGTHRLEFWQAIEYLARGLSGHQRTNISLNRSRLLLTNGVLQGAVLMTSDAIPGIEFLLVDVALNRVEVGSILLTAVLEPLQASGVHQVTACVHEDDAELLSLLERFGFTASNQTA